MKSTKRLIPAAVLSLLLMLGQTGFAQYVNDYLVLQSLENPLDGAMMPVSASVHSAWRTSGVRKIRKQHEGDAPGSFRMLLDFDAKGNLVRKEAEGGKTSSLQYDATDHLRKISNFDGKELASTQYFYYDRKDNLRKSVMKFEGSTNEIEGFYDSQMHLNRVRYYTKGVATKTVNIQYTYDEVGNLIAMTAPGLNVTYLYNNGKLYQMKEEKVGVSTQTTFAWDGNNIKEWKVYQEKDGDLILDKTVSYEYNNAKLPARKTVKGRGPNSETQITNVYYDEFMQNSVAMRGDDWDGGGFGYGTPVLISWDNPNADTRVIDSIYDLKLNLKPGVGQPMPEIKNITLRLNSELTNREIGDVVLRKKGVGDSYYIEETLPLAEGSNTIHLEVETQYGKFSSGERYITYKNPNREIKVKDLHILAIGIDDYSDDNLDLKNSNSDVQKLVSSMETQKGRLFGEVKTKVLSDKEATKANIEDAIRQIKGKAAKEDLVLIYFAGHGAEANGNFFLKPSDVKAETSELENSAIDNRWVLEEISRYSAPTLYFMDASHSNASAEGATVGVANMDAVSNDFGSVINNDDEIRIFLSSTSAKQKSNAKSGDEKGSFFADAMLEGLGGKADTNGNGLVTVEELSDYVADRVLGMTSWKQKPMVVKRGIGMVPLAKVGGN